MIVFFAFILIIAFLYRNWFGILGGFGIILAIIMGFYQRSVMTQVLYEKVLSRICLLSLTSTSCAISEKYVIPLLDKNYNTDRIAAMFFHPNYFGTITATVIIICAYKVLTKQGHKWAYYVIALMNVLSIYLCASMFAWIEVFIGIATLLMILKKHRLLAVWFFSATLAGFVIFILNINLIPRLSDVELTIKLRLEIWKFAIQQIKISSFFGHGLMSYAYLSNKLGKLVPHAHSIYLDMMMNFGIVGTALFLRYFVNYYVSVIKMCFNEKKTLITSLILAVTVAVLVHGTTDITILWIQTLPLFLIILSGLGAYEKS